MNIRQKHKSAFTLIEVAIALGVIAFALVAIIGVLPSGMQVQRDNRQDTIINQDGAYLMEAIRNSSENIPDLIDFCEQINGSAPTSTMRSYDIITNLCAPDVTNTAIFRSITGPAVMRGANVPTFRYLVRSEIRQISTVNPDLPQAGAMGKHEFDVRLIFLWPVLPNGILADSPQRQIMRSQITGVYDPTNGVFNLAEFRK